MKSKILKVTIIFSLAVVLLSGWFYYLAKGVDAQEQKSTYIVALNEIRLLIKNGDNRQAQEKITALQEDMRLSHEQENGVIFIPVICFVSVLFFIVAFGYIYLAILRPFDKMKEFAVKISAGNFNLPLQYQRSNYKGKSLRKRSHRQ